MEDKNLHPERYDGKLYKQAVKASLIAKKAEKERKNRRQKYALFLLILLPIFFFSFIYISKIISSRLSYVRSYSSELDFSEVEVANTIDHGTVFIDNEYVNSKSALLANLYTGEIVYKKNIDEKLPVASISKLFTAKVGLEYFDLEDTLLVKQDWNEIEGMTWTLGLNKGDSIKVKDLIETMMIISYNDAAYTLADGIEGGWEEFVIIMNQRAKELDLMNTYFHNPSGLDALDPLDDGYSTVYDVYKMVKLAYKDEFVKIAMSKSYRDVVWEGGSKEIYSTNQLFGKYNIIAAKTGNTDNAGGCFVAINKDGYVSIVINSNTRFEDTAKLFSLLD